MTYTPPTDEQRAIRRKEAEEDDRTRKAETALLRARLTSKGIRLKTWGCGCCGSPELKIEIDGEVLFDHDSVDFDMFKDEDE